MFDDCVSCFFSGGGRDVCFSLQNANFDDGSRQHLDGVAGSSVGVNFSQRKTRKGGHKLAFDELLEPNIASAQRNQVQANSNTERRLIGSGQGRT